MKKTISALILFIMLLTTTSFADTFFDIPVWNHDNLFIETNSETYKEDFLNLESQSAILIEQSTRKNII
jgi:hypothetical protein